MYHVPSINSAHTLKNVFSVMGHRTCHRKVYQQLSPVHVAAQPSCGTLWPNLGARGPEPSPKSPDTARAVPPLRRTRPKVTETAEPGGTSAELGSPHAEAHLISATPGCGALARDRWSRPRIVSQSRQSDEREHRPRLSRGQHWFKVRQNHLFDKVGFTGEVCRHLCAPHSSCQRKSPPRTLLMALN